MFISGLSHTDFMVVIIQFYYVMFVPMMISLDTMRSMMYSNSLDYTPQFQSDDAILLRKACSYNWIVYINDGAG